jgi:hypothetical protein
MEDGSADRSFDACLKCTIFQVSMPSQHHQPPVQQSNGQQYPKDDYLVLVVGSQNGAIRYQEISGDDGSSTMADGIARVYSERHDPAILFKRVPSLSGQG